MLNALSNSLTLKPNYRLRSKVSKMYGLPPNTLINKPLYKKAVFEKFNLKAASKRVKSDARIGSSEREQSRPEVKAAERDRFDADISRIHILVWIAPKRLPALSETGEVKSFYVMQIGLKHQACAEQNLVQLQKLIGQKMVFALQWEGQTQLCFYHGKLLRSEWKPTEESAITLKGLSIDDAWRNIVAQIGGLDAYSEQTLDEQIEAKVQREKLLKQIETLERQCRVEKQTRKKFELHQQILKLKEQL